MLYNQANFWLYKAMQEYHLEETTEEAIIKRQYTPGAPSGVAG